MSNQFKNLTPVLLLFLLITPFLLVAQSVALMTQSFSYFYLFNNQSFFLAILLVFFTFCQKGELKLPPFTALCAFVFAVFLFLQSQFIKPIFNGEVYAVIAVFVLGGLLAWAIQYWSDNNDKISLIRIIAWGIFICSVLQSIVGIVQFFGLPIPYILKSKSHELEGQLLQSNMLGHYLTWGVISWAYLWNHYSFRKSIGVGVVLVLTAILGLVSSRSIILYLVTLSILIFVWWLLEQRKNNRFILFLALSLIAILFFQLTMPWFVSLFNFSYQSGATTLTTGGSIYSRLSEWHKAWLLFLKSPLIGQGWGSYASKSFLLPEANGYRQYDLHSIFGHSHNIVMQLLAETGIVGTLILAFAVLKTIWHAFFYRTHQGLFLLSLIFISLTHSLVEFPLWYCEYLFPFIIFLVLLDNLNNPPKKIKLPAWSKLFILLFCIATTFRFLLINQSYAVIYVATEIDLKMGKGQQKEKAVNSLYEISQLEPFLERDIGFRIGTALDVDDDILPPKELALVMRSVLDLPGGSYNAFARGLYLYRLNHLKEADEWIRATTRYYPQMLPEMVATTKNSKHFKELHNELLTICEDYHKKYPDSRSCTATDTENNDFKIKMSSDSRT